MPARYTGKESRDIAQKFNQKEEGSICIPLIHLDQLWSRIKLWVYNGE